ncbi:MAG: sucrose-phosphate phosphatase [Leptolyngbyaceae cyanobacterium CSU_1_3]|nr:sucrose-phosphate phosphatase [Leptolyngbyaceae cyanobacterium CSU_1_3]
MARFLFVTDLDNTLVGDHTALQQLNRLLSEHRQTHQTKIVYSTGRSLTLYRQLTTEHTLLEPDVLIAGVGTEIYADGDTTPDRTWSEKLAIAWNREAIVAATAHFADLVPQPETEQSPFKVSFFLTEDAAIAVLPQIESLLQQQGLSIQLIYSSGKDLDILPSLANKGAAMSFVRQNFGIEASQTVVCGDSGNDIALFSVGEERGIIVGNAQPELLTWHRHHSSKRHYFAQSHYAAGILEGLHHFNFLP